MNTTLTTVNKSCTTCGDQNFDRSAVIYYNKGTFCSIECKEEDIRRTNLRSEHIKYVHRLKESPGFTLMMHSTSGRK